MTAKRKLSALFYAVGEVKGVELNTQWETLQFLKKAGFKTSVNAFKAEKEEDVLDYVGKWQEKRESLEYEIDGIVVKVNSFDKQKI